jgi:hypothetical protein
MVKREEQFVKHRSRIEGELIEEMIKREEQLLKDQTGIE